MSFENRKWTRGQADWDTYYNDALDDIGAAIAAAGEGTAFIMAGSETQRLAATPYEGLVWIETDTGKVWRYDGTKGWVQIAPSRGYIHGFDQNCTSGATVNFGTGAVENAWSLYGYDSADTYDAHAAFGGDFTADDWYAIYLDPPATGSSFTSADLVTSASLPEYDDSKKGWFHPTDTDQRCIGLVKAQSSTGLYTYKRNGSIFTFLEPLEILNTNSPATSKTSLATGIPDLSKSLPVFVHGRAYKAGAGPTVSVYNGDQSGYAGAMLQGAPYLGSWGAGHMRRLTDDQGDVLYSATANSTVGIHINGIEFPEGL